MIDEIQQSLDEMQVVLKRLRENSTAIESIKDAALALSKSLKDGGKVLSCGNGGSHCDAMHFAEELSGRFRDDRKPLAALAISDPAYITCTGNDFGFNEIFSRFILGHGRKGDILLAISTSGKSENIIRAAKAAKSVGMKVITMTGKEDTALHPLSDIVICTPGTKYADRVQELHIKVIHILIEQIEKQLFAKGG